MKKFRWYYDKDKEEVWLNEMSDKGWAMTGFFLGLYTFVPCNSGQYTYQIDMPRGIGESGADVEKREYIRFVEETGAEYVCEWFLWVIFRKERSLGEFKLYTDCDSQISCYKRIRRLFLWATGIEILAASSMIGTIYHGIELFHITFFILVGFIIIIFLRMILKVTSKIKELEQRKMIES